MEAISPSSATAKPSRARSAPPLPVPPASVALPLAFAITGLAALGAGIAWIIATPSLLAGYHYNQYVIAATHLFVLGWICSVVMGSMYQLVPVALETRLHSPALARWQWAFHVVGFAGMVWMFRAWNMKQVGHFASVFAIGVGLFVYNIARTLRKAPRWNVTATAITAALGWLTLTIVAGLSIAAGKCTYSLSETGAAQGWAGSLIHGLRSIAGYVGRFDPISAMHAHAHLGAIGCFTLLIVGVSYKLIPMFTISEIQSGRRAALSVGLLNVGLAGSFVTILLRSPLKLVFALVIVAGLAVYAWELTAILRARKRRALDWGIRQFLTAVALLAPLSILAVALSWPGLPLNRFTGQLENLYGFLGLLGVISFAIIGMLYKIIPFLVWFGTYSKHAGRAQVPALPQLYSTRLQFAGYWTYLAGLAVTTPAVLASSETAVRVGCILLALSLTTLMVNIALLFSHFVRPRLKTLIISPVLNPKPA